MEQLTVETKNELFPIFLKTNQLKVLIIGGGTVALEKLQALLNNSPMASTLVVAKVFSPDFLNFSEKFPTIKLEQREVEAIDFTHKHLVISALNDVNKSAELYEIAKEYNVLYNAADKPELCDFYLSSIVQKGHLKIAVSTNGKSPTIAKRLKEVLNNHLPNELEHTLENMNQLRNTLEGDFAFKVQRLNDITEVLVLPKRKNYFERNLKWLIWTVSLLFLAGLGFTLWNTEPSFKDFVLRMDSLFYYFLAAGFVFALIDGAIGMSYGVTTTTFSLAVGLPPASSSMGIHISEILSNGIAGWMHYKMGNVNWKLFKLLIVPAIGGAVIGAYILSSLEEYSALVKPLVAVYTLVLGIVIFNKAILSKRKKAQGVKIKRIGVLGFIGGFIDAAFGGGWGSIVLSSLIAGGRHPLFSLGTVKISRFFIATLSSITFFFMTDGKYWPAVVGLVIGSAIAAPIAAKVSNHMKAKTIMIAVSFVVIVASAYSIIKFITKFI